MQIKSITVTLTSSTDVDKKYIDLASQTGKQIADKEFDLVYGGTSYGMMFNLADSFKKSGGRKVIGILAKSLMEITPNYKVFEGLDERIIMPTVAERKNKLIELGDAFIILPGGFGTLEELSQIIASKEQKQHTKPIAFVNLDGYYDNLYNQYLKYENEGFTKAKINELIFMGKDLNEVFDYFNSYAPSVFEDRFV